MGEPFRFVAEFDVDDSYCELKYTFDVAHNLVQTCMRDLLALMVIMFSSIPLIILMFLTCIHNLVLPPSIVLMRQICDSNANLGYEGNSFNVLS